MSNVGEYHYINGEWLSLCQIYSKYHVSIKTFRKKKLEFNNNDKLIEKWLNSDEKRGARVNKIPVTALNVTYESINKASSSLNITVNTLKRIFSKSKCQEDIDAAIIAVYRKREKSTYKGRKYEKIKDIYLSEGISPGLETTYKDRLKRGETITREYFIAEYMVYCKLTENGFVSLKECEGFNIGSGYLQDIVIADRLFYSYKTAANFYNTTVDAIRSVVKIKKWCDREKVLLKKIENKKLLFSDIVGMSKVDFCREYNISIYTLNEILKSIKSDELSKEVLLCKINNLGLDYTLQPPVKRVVNVFNIKFLGLKSISSVYGIPVYVLKKFFGKKNEYLTNDKCVYNAAIYMLNVYFSEPQNKKSQFKMVFSKATFAYKHKDMCYFECTFLDGTKSILSNREIVSKVFGCDMITKLDSCISDYENIYCKVGR